MSVQGWISRKTRQIESALVTQPARESYIEALRLLRVASTASSRAAMALLRPLISRFDVFVDVELEPSVEEWILHKTCQLESALVNRDVRASYIKDLHLLATASTAPSLIAILRQTPSLHLLSIGPPEINGESKHFHLRCRDNTSSLLKSFIDLPPFNFLLDLSVRITEDQWSRFWHSLRRIAPNLVRLDVNLFVPIESPITPEAASTALPPSVGTLSVTATPEKFDYLVNLIHLTPTLQRVHLRGCQLDRSPLDQPAINTLHSCNVKRLELTFDTQATNSVWHNMLRQPGAFKNVEKLTVGFPDDWVNPFCSNCATC